MFPISPKSLHRTLFANKSPQLTHDPSPLLNSLLHTAGFGGVERLRQRSSVCFVFALFVFFRKSVEEKNGCNHAFCQRAWPHKWKTAWGDEGPKGVKLCGHVFPCHAGWSCISQCCRGTSAQPQHTAADGKEQRGRKRGGRLSFRFSTKVQKSRSNRYWTCLVDSVGET